MHTKKWIFCILIVFLIGCSTSNYDFSVVESQIEKRWARTLHGSDIQGIRLGYILYELGKTKRIVIADSDTILICKMSNMDTGGCSNIHQVNLNSIGKRDRRLVDIRFVNRGNHWKLVNKGPYPNSVSAPDLASIHLAIQTLIDNEGV